MKFPDQYRSTLNPNGYASKNGDPYGMFIIPGREACGRALKVIAVDGQKNDINPDGWEHVSVSIYGNAESKCPSWQEMCAVKDLFWNDTECVVQFHVPKSDHISHREVLHLWRLDGKEFPLPPKIFV